MSQLAGGAGQTAWRLVTLEVEAGAVNRSSNFAQIIARYNISRSHLAVAISSVGESVEEAVVAI